MLQDYSPWHPHWKGRTTATDSETHL